MDGISYLSAFSSAFSAACSHDNLQDSGRVPPVGSIGRAGIVTLRAKMFAPLRPDLNFKALRFVALIVLPVWCVSANFTLVPTEIPSFVAASLNELAKRPVSRRGLPARNARGFHGVPSGALAFLKPSCTFVRAAAAAAARIWPMTLAVSFALYLDRSIRSPSSFLFSRLCALGTRVRRSSKCPAESRPGRPVLRIVEFSPRRVD